jgi:Cu2+-exporting ATPase
MGLLAGPFFRGAWQLAAQPPISAWTCRWSLGIVITFVASTGATFDPGGIFGSEVYFDSMTMFVSFLLAARYVELRARQRAAESLEGAWPACPRPPGGWPPTARPSG